jgi:hypothetical protein
MAKVDELFLRPQLPRNGVLTSHPSCADLLLLIDLRAIRRCQAMNAVEGIKVAELDEPNRLQCRKGRNHVNEIEDMVSDSWRRRE